VCITKPEKKSEDLGYLRFWSEKRGCEISRGKVTRPNRVKSPFRKAVYSVTGKGKGWSGLETLN